MPRNAKTKFKVGARVCVAKLIEPTAPELERYIGKIGYISEQGDSRKGIAMFYVRFEDGSPSKKFFADELLLSH